MQRCWAVVDEAVRISPLIDTIDASSCTGCVAPDVCKDGGCRATNYGFRRIDASLEILVVTDEDDGSTATAADALAFLNAQVASSPDSFVRMHGLLPTGSGCSFPTNIAKWQQVIGSTGGTIHDLCAADYSSAITTLASRLFGLQTQFFLTQNPTAEDTITISVDGLAVTHYTYDATSNSITFDSPPAEGAAIVVEFQIPCGG